MLHHPEFWWRFFPRNELRQVYLATAIRSFAISLLGIFVPLYLHREMGISLEQTLLYFLQYSAVFAIAMPLAAAFAARYGIRHSVLLSAPFYLTFVGLLYALPVFPTPLWLGASLLGVSQAFYWMGMHLVFYHASHRNHRGEEIGKRTSVTVIASVFGPLAGGLLIHTLGFPVVFGIVSLLLVLASIVLFRSQEGYARYHFSLRSVLNREHWKDSLFFVSRGTYVIAEGVLWPIFIFFILRSYFSLGVAGSVLSGVSALLLWAVGRYSDHTDKLRIIRNVIALDSLTWVLRALVATPLHVFGVTILAAVSHGIRESPTGALEYDKARGKVAAYFVSREVFICLGRILLLSLVLLTDNLAGGFIFQAVINVAALLF